MANTYNISLEISRQRGGRGEWVYSSDYDDLESVCEDLRTENAALKARIDELEQEVADLTNA